MPSTPHPYLDPALPCETRLDDLLARMTLEEKVAQLSAAWMSEVSEALPDDPAAEPDYVFSPAKAQARIPHGIGQITRPGGSTGCLPASIANANNVLQAFLRQHTRLGIPALIHEECLSGLMTRQGTTFPQIIGLASTWDPGLVEACGSVIHLQLRALGSQQGLSPVLDIARDPRWGRIEETYGEDPTLAAALGCAYVRGVQMGAAPAGQRTVIATGKHFAAHGLPAGGLNWGPVHLGERELREVFLYPFEAAVKTAGLGALMSNYHEMDGIPGTASHFLLTEILRDEWGFEGIVVSDYNAVVMLADYHHVAADKSEAGVLALQAGMDLELPATDCYGEPLLEAIRAGRIASETIECSVRRILAMKFRLGLFENPFVDPAQSVQAFGRGEQKALARLAAEKSLVLLKNEGSLLPLSPSLGSLAVIGPNAHSLRRLVGDYAYGSFTELMEGVPLDPVLGGGQANQPTRFPERFPAEAQTILEAIRQRVSPGTTVHYAEGCDYRGSSSSGFAEAVAIANQSQAVILVMGGKSGLTADCTTGELRDAAHLELPGVQPELVKAILQTGKPVVLVVVGGRPAAIPELAKETPAILQAWLPGEDGGPAVAGALFGDFSPGGKLPVTMPRSSAQVPLYYGHKPSGGQSYNFIDYVNESVQPVFPFGHGLSYTAFAYSDLEISPEQPGAGETVTIALSIRNTGEREGDEVVQLYTRDLVASVTRPIQELKAFERLTLLPGESRRVVFDLPTSQLAFYNLDMQYVLEPGAFEVMVGSSSADIRLGGHFTVTGEVLPVTEKHFFLGKN